MKEFDKLKKKKKTKKLYDSSSGKKLNTFFLQSNAPNFLNILPSNQHR